MCEENKEYTLNARLPDSAFIVIGAAIIVSLGAALVMMFRYLF